MKSLIRGQHHRLVNLTETTPEAIPARLYKPQNRDSGPNSQRQRAEPPREIPCESRDHHQEGSPGIRSPHLRGWECATCKSDENNAPWRHRSDAKHGSGHRAPLHPGAKKMRLVYHLPIRDLGCAMACVPQGQQRTRRQAEPRYMSCSALPAPSKAGCWFSLHRHPELRITRPIPGDQASGNHSGKPSSRRMPEKSNAAPRADRFSAFSALLSSASTTARPPALRAASRGVFPFNAGTGRSIHSA